MSGTGDILAPAAGAAIIVPLAAAAVAVGALALTGKVLAGGVKLAAKGVDVVRKKRVQSSIGKYNEKLEQFSQDMNEELAREADALEARYAESMQLIREAGSEELDMSGYIAECAKEQKKLFAEFDRVQAQIEQKSRETIKREKMRIESQIAAEREAAEQSIRSLGNDLNARNEKARAAAEALIAQAEQAVEDIRAGYGESPAGRQIYERLRTALDTTRGYYSGGQYEVAVADAYSVISQAATKAADILAEERKALAAHSKAAAAVSELKELQKSFSAIKYTFTETVSGEPAEYDIQDFSAYFGSEWQRVGEAVEQTEKQLNSQDFEYFTPEELTDCCLRLAELKEEFLNGLTKAYDRLHNNLMRNEYAELIANAYYDMGFDEVDAGEQEPLKETVMLFESAENGDMVRVTLKPELTASGKLEIAIEVENHNDTEREDLEQLRESQRENVCRELSDSGLGQRLGIRAKQSCRGATRNRNSF